MAKSKTLLTQGYHEGCIEEFITDLGEFNNISDHVIKFSNNYQSVCYRHRVSGSTVENSTYFDYDRAYIEKQYRKENNVTVSQQWWESCYDNTLFDLLGYYKKEIGPLVVSLYNNINIDDLELGGTNFTLYENDDFICQHHDGKNFGRICIVLIYLSKECDYNDGGGRLIISDSNLHKEILPLRGNFVVFDYTKFNLSHQVESVRNNFRRYSCISIVQTKTN